MTKTIALAGGLGLALLNAGAVTSRGNADYPVSENLRGHENIEWSTSYAYHLTDGSKDLPRGKEKGQEPVNMSE